MGNPSPNTLAKFKALGLHTPFDFVLHLPRRYEDLTRLHHIASLQLGQQAYIEGVIEGLHIRQGTHLQLIGRLRDESGSIRLRWVHFYPNQKAKFEKLGRVRVQGEVRGSEQWGYEIIHPKFSEAKAPLPNTLTPIYPATQGLHQDTLRKAIKQAFKQCDIQELLPVSFLERYALMPLSQALDALHHPKVDEREPLLNRTHPAWRRVKFDEMLAQQIALQEARDSRQRLRAHALSLDEQHPLYQAVLQAFGHPLTAAQMRVLAQMREDLARPFPMHRLLQGDVGSGKTIVAALLAAMVIAQGGQVALMVPTEILAEQHTQKMQAWFAPQGVEVAYLVSDLKAKAKKALYQQIQSGQAKLVVGTQALIQDAVQFAQLDLVIIDEQHRFGVGQRLHLNQKGQEHHHPHQLHMSATPIPRSLAMSYLADLDVSVLDELPPGREPIITKLINQNRYSELIGSLCRACEEGRQVYWVCPLIEESETLQLQTAVKTHEMLCEALPHLRIGLLHGRLTGEEKAAIMHAFAEHALDVLVATTVIEVGVDVPNASIIVIENAERFGLAQLHQLRGRVGRGATQSYCLLVYQAPLSSTANIRLRAMYETQDGFEIARRDLALRGPGEFLGLRQSGDALFRFVDMQEDAELIEQAREAALLLLQQYRSIALAHRDRWLRIRQDYLRS